MLAKRFILFLFCLVPLWARAQSSSLSGRITDTSQAPVQGAIVSLPDLRTGAVSDADGRYFIDHLPRGNYLVQVHMIGFSTLTVTLHIEGSTHRDFLLSESVLERNEVVVTGTSLATEMRKSPVPIASVPMKDLQENASTNIIDAVSRIPGVNQVTTGPAVSKPIIRGLGANRILVVSDNVRQEGQQWGDEHGIEIDDYNVSKVEVLKGPASLAYGSDALAGVINIVTDEPYSERGAKGNFSLNYQTNNGLLAGHLNLSGNKRGLSWKVYGTGKMAHDYQNNYDGYVFNSRFRNADFGAMLGVNKQWGYSRLSFSSFNQTLGIAEGDRDSAGNFVKPVNLNGVESIETVSGADGLSYQKQHPYQIINHQKLAWNNSLFLHNGARLGLTLGFQQNTRKEMDNVLEPATPGLHFLLHTYSYDLKYFFAPVRDWQITAGVNGMYQHNSNKGVEFLIPDYALFDIGAYAIARRDIGKWSLSGGLRYDNRTLHSTALFVDSTGEKVDERTPWNFVKFNAFNRSFSNITGSVGASFSVTKRLTLKANLASGYRAPNIAELSANGVHEGTIRYEYGNNELKAENSLQADLGVDFQSDHIYCNASVFGNYIRNFIYLRKLVGANGTDSIPAVNDQEGYSAFAYDQADALLYGGELYIDLHPHPFDWLHFDNTFSYVRGKRLSDVSDSTENLPSIPPARWLSELRVQKNNLGRTLRNGYVKLGLDVNFAQDNVFGAYATETPAAAYALLQAGLGFELVSKKQQTLCSFVLSVQNLLDTPYQSHLSRLRYASLNEATGRTGIWNMGRNISLLLRVPLSL